MKLTKTTLVQRAGLWLDYWTAQLWDKLVKKFPGLILTQGVRSGAAASGGTHLGLGVLDLYLGKWAKSWRTVLRYAFDIGFFGWYRPAIKGVWKTHIHLGVRGCKDAAQSLKNQFQSWLRGRNGLRGDGRDPFTYRPKNKTKAAPYRAPAGRAVDPLFNVSFLNTAGNNATLWKTFEKRLGSMARASVSGSPAIVGYCEVRRDQEPRLTESMRRKTYGKIAYDHMLALYIKAEHTLVSSSFDRFTVQDGGTVEGLLRFRFLVKGVTPFQGGVTHLDHDSPWEKKKSNLREAVASLERYGEERHGDEWRERTILFGDFNESVERIGSVLIPLGFELVYADGIDQIWTGKKRARRGGKKTKTNSDHKRILGMLGKYR